MVPPIAFVAGISTVLRWGPEHLARTPLCQTFIAVQNPDFPVVLVLAYVVLALPFVYRSLDAGLRAIDVRTLVEAARNCGASWPHVLFRVIAAQPARARSPAPPSSPSRWCSASSPSPRCSATSRSRCGS